MQIREAIAAATARQDLEFDDMLAVMRQAISAPRPIASSKVPAEATTR